MTPGRPFARVRFAYMYRDAGNYKQHGAVVLSNTEGLGIESAEIRLRAMCDGDCFNAAQVGLHEPFFEDGATDDDHAWHEFVSLEATQDEPTDVRSLK